MCNKYNSFSNKSILYKLISQYPYLIKFHILFMDTYYHGELEEKKRIYDGVIEK